MKKRTRYKGVGPLRKLQSILPRTSQLNFSFGLRGCDAIIEGCWRYIPWELYQGLALESSTKEMYETPVFILPKFCQLRYHHIFTVLFPQSDNPKGIQFCLFPLLEQNVFGRSEYFKIFLANGTNGSCNIFDIA